MLRAAAAVVGLLGAMLVIWRKARFLFLNPAALQRPSRPAPGKILSFPVNAAQPSSSSGLASRSRATSSLGVMPNSRLNSRAELLTRS